MSFESDLGDLGFELVQRTRDGGQRFSRRSNPYLQWWVMAFADGTAELTWEFELGAYLKAKGFHVAVQDELSLLLFPAGEVRGPADGAWIAEQTVRAEAALGSVDLVGGG